MSLLQEAIELGVRNLKDSGRGFYVATCPFHKQGKESNPSFSFNIDTGVWKCFTCGVAGDLDKLHYKITGKPRQVTLEHALRIIDELEYKPVIPDHDEKVQITEEELKEYRKRVHEDIYKRVHESKEVINHFELGFDINKHKTIIPVRDAYRNLVGYSERASQSFGSRYIDRLKKSKYVYHLWHVKEYEEAIVTEGPFDVINAYALGFPNTIGLFGMRMSAKQETLILRYFKTLVLALDNDNAGREGIEFIKERLQGRINLGVFQFPPEKKDLGELTKEELKTGMQNTKWL